MDWELARILPEVENAFGFSIPDEDAAELNTADKLHAYILAHRYQGRQDARLNSIAFHKIRRALMSVLRIPRNAVRASIDLSEIIPRRRRRTWRAIGNTSGLRLPFLRRPSWVVTVATIAAIGLGVAVSVLLGLKPFRGGVLVAILSTGVFGYALFWLTTFLACESPREVATIGQLTKAILARNYQSILAESKKSATDQEIWDILRPIIGVQVKVQPSQCANKAEFPKNLIAG